ncbi:MAG: hypothetical protein M1813_000123 [Trichoglossum hirsutum]|nr:MAG: hypothetical protein M1813_000123 [Trichoglossum hirsutum]
MASATNGNAFYRALDRFQASLTPSEKADFQVSSLDDVYDTITAIQDEQLPRKTMRNLNRMKPFLEGLDQLGKVLEVFLNTSTFVAFVWGPLKFMLQTASTLEESFDQLLNAYEQIGERMPQLQKYEEIFSLDPRMQKVLEQYYEDILEFHRRALKFFSRRGWKLLFKATWKTFETRFRVILDNLDRDKNLIESQACLLDIEESQLARGLAEDTFLRMKNEELKRQRIAVIEWLSPANSTMDQESYSSLRALYPGTGLWLLSDAKLKAWSDPLSSDVPILWVHGIPGSGKTILASVVVEEVTKITSVSVGYFYCKHKNPFKNSFASIARGILAQLISRNEDILPFVYDKQASSGEVTLQSTKLLREVFDVVLAAIDKVVIILDGLDECEKEERKTTLSWLQTTIAKVIDTNPGSLRVLIFSTDEPDIRRSLSNATIKRLETLDNRSDILSYIEIWSCKIAEKFKISQVRKEEIVSQISERTRGMFLFAYLVMVNLHSQSTLEELHCELRPDRLPEGLDQAYGRIVERTFRNPNRSQRDHAKRLLGWVVSALRPLKWYEIQGAISIQLESRSVDFENRHLRIGMKDLCGSLIEVQPDDTIELVHTSATLYLTTHNYVNAISANLELASLCLNYLNFDCYNPSLLDNEIRNFVSEGYYSFQEYATAHCLDHVEVCVEGIDKSDVGKYNPLVGLLGNFLSEHWFCSCATIEASPATRAKFSTFADERFFDHMTRFFSSGQSNSTLGSYGLEPDSVPGPSIQRRTRSIIEEIAHELRDDTTKMDKLRSHYGHNLFKCHQINCVYFYEGFSTVQERSQHLGKHKSPYHCTHHGCHRTDIGYSSASQLRRHIVDFHGAAEDEKVRFPHPRKPPELDIFKAVAKGRTRIVKQLLEEGIDVREKTRGKRLKREGLTLLHIAAENNRDTILSLLVEKGVDLNSQGYFGSTALHLAASMGHDVIVKLLLRYGADRHIRNREGFTALSVAAESGDNEVAQLLLAGEDLQYEEISTALGIAVEKGHDSVARLLQDKRAQLTSGNRSDETPLLSRDPNVGDYLADLDPDKLPPHLKKAGSDWSVVFNPLTKRILDVNLVHTLPHDSVVCCVEFSPDGKYLATGRNRAAQIFGVQTGERVSYLQHDSVNRDDDMYVRCVCFSPDGRYLATGAEDKLLRVWDIESKAIKHTFKGHEQDIYSLDFASNGYIASGSGDRTVRVWDNNARQQVLTLQIEDEVSSVAISPDNRYVTAGVLDKSVRVWDITTGHLVGRFEGYEGHKDSVYSVSFAPNGRDVISGSLDKTIKMWQVKSQSEVGPRGGDCIRTFEGHKDFVLSVAMTPDGRWVLSGSKDRSIHFWDPQSGDSQLMLVGHRNSGKFPPTI